MSEERYSVPGQIGIGRQIIPGVHKRFNVFVILELAASLFLAAIIGLGFGYMGWAITLAITVNFIVYMIIREEPGVPQSVLDLIIAQYKFKNDPKIYQRSTRESELVWRENPN